MNEHIACSGRGDAGEVAIRNVLADADLLPQDPGAQCRDYNFREYSPRANPRGRAHSATLLLSLARQAGLRDSVQTIVERLWAHLGRDQVVWGAKWTRDGFHSFEFYVYNREELRPLQLRSVSGLKGALAPWLDHVIPPNEACRYTMCSLELDACGAGVSQTTGVRIYVAGGDEKRRQEAFSYGVLADGLQLENHYTWYYATSELGEVRQRLGWSAHAFDKRAWELLLPSELCECQTICYATKRACDGLYFNRVTTQQLAWFAQLYLPAYVGGVLCLIGSGFDHLFWDVGFDFLVSAEDPLVRLGKLGVYGYL